MNFVHLKAKLDVILEECENDMMAFLEHMRGAMPQFGLLIMEPGNHMFEPYGDTRGFTWKMLVEHWEEDGEAPDAAALAKLLGALPNEEHGDCLLGVADLLWGEEDD